LESSGWGMVSSQNIDVKELTSIILNANYLALEVGLSAGAGGWIAGWGAILLRAVGGMVMLVSWVDLCQGKHLEWN
jgi:hypothetical protein